MNKYPANFSRQELLFSATGTRLGIDNTPDSQEKENNILKTALFLQDLRDKLKEHYKKDVPIRVYSCYRSEELNNAVGGSKTSAHKNGLAADIVAVGLSNKELGNFIVTNLEFDQLIYEFGESGWIHVGIKTEKSNRRMVLSASKVNGKTVYKHLV